MEAVGICAHPQHGAEFVRPLCAIFDVNAHTRFIDVIGPRGGQPLTRDAAVQLVVDAVVLELHTDGVFRRAAHPTHGPGVARVDTKGGAFVRLCELVAVHGVVQKIGEVREQRQLVPEHIRIDLAACTAGVRAPPRTREAVAAGLAAVGGVNRIKATHAAVVHGALRYLIGCAPLRVIGHQAHIEAITLAALAVAQHAIELAVIVLQGEGAIISKHLQRIQQSPVTQFGRRCQKCAGIAVLAEADTCDALGQGIGVLHADRACR